MNNDINETLFDSFTEVMERMAFMFVDIAEEGDIPETAPGSKLARMSFSGEKSGFLELIVTAGFSRLIAENVLGVDENDEVLDEGSSDALKEVLNVTCGHILTAVAGTDPIFDLSVPEVKVLSEEEWKSYLDNPEALGFLVDDSPVMLRFEIHD